MKPVPIGEQKAVSLEKSFSLKRSLSKMLSFGSKQNLRAKDGVIVIEWPMKGIEYYIYHPEKGEKSRKYSPSIDASKKTCCGCERDDLEPTIMPTCCVKFCSRVSFCTRLVLAPIVVVLLIITFLVEYTWKAFKCVFMTTGKACVWLLCEDEREKVFAEPPKEEDEGFDDFDPGVVRKVPVPVPVPASHLEAAEEGKQAGIWAMGRCPEASLRNVHVLNVRYIYIYIYIYYSFIYIYIGYKCTNVHIYIEHIHPHTVHVGVGKLSPLSKQGRNIEASILKHTGREGSSPTATPRQLASTALMEG
jgi:hypothetical protein